MELSLSISESLFANFLLTLLNRTMKKDITTQTTNSAPKRAARKTVEVTGIWAAVLTIGNLNCPAYNSELKTGGDRNRNAQTMTII
jgi:hypothetical protein